jgi:hypothetical protein
VVVDHIVACPRHLYSVFRAGHPSSTPTRLPRWGPRLWLRCSSLRYSRYPQSSRLAIRAPRSEIRCTIDADRPLGRTRSKNHDPRNAENQLTKTSRNMVAAATTAALKEAHVERVGSGTRNRLLPG